jgi:hypothetical protein
MTLGLKIAYRSHIFGSMLSHFWLNVKVILVLLDLLNLLYKFVSEKKAPKSLYRNSKKLKFVFISVTVSNFESGFLKTSIL